MLSPSLAMVYGGEMNSSPDPRYLKNRLQRIPSDIRVGVQTDI